MEKTMIKLSVIIAYYNAERYIKGLLDELLDQGFTENEFEIIVVDDESTHSIDVLKDYCAIHHNVKYVWQKNARQSAARNVFFRHKKAELYRIKKCLVYNQYDHTALLH